MSSLGDVNANPFTFDPADPLAGIRRVEDVDEDKRVGEVGQAVRAMAAAGVLDAVTEEIVRDYVTRRKLLGRAAFRSIVRESRPYRPAVPSHLHTSLPPAQTPGIDGCEDDGCEAPPPSWAEGTDILGRLVRDLRARCGLTGEERNARLVYLIVASRLLDHPASAAVKGLSGAGKSYTVECVLRAFPASSVIVMTAMSEHALIYMRESFAHRTLVLYEATALREGREKNEGNQTAMFIRTLLSEGRLVYPTVQKDERGNLVTITIEKEGPTNFLVTTTATSLHNENETRMLSLAADDSKAQTTSVLKAIAGGKKRSPADFSDWHALDHWMRHANHDVTVPYADYLADVIPPVAVRLRRDFATLLALVETHAIIHQLDRETNEHGQIVASPDDYLAVRELVADLMSDAVGTTVKATVRQTVEAVKTLDSPAGVTVKQLADHLKLERSAAQYRVQAAREGGYILNIEDRRGMPARYRLDNPLPAEVTLLPEAVPGDFHTLTVSDRPAAADSQATRGCEGVNGPQRGEAPAFCTVCRTPLSPARAAAGDTTHPTCEASPDGGRAA
jgi:hypothetical protein